MSFSGMVKEELSRQTSTARHCRIAETAALLSACGRITKDGSLRFQTENNAVVRKYFTLLQKTFNIDTEIAIRESSMLKKGNVYHVEITDLLQVQNVLQGTKLSVNEADRGTLFLENGLITQQNCCKRAFVRGAFLASGSISDPEKGYHFEIVCQDEVKAENLRDIIHTFQIDAKIVLRKKSYVVYVKEGAQIVDMLAIMEANVALMNLENIRILKEMRNSVNRKVNCETANINKTVSAAVKQIEDIRLIKENTENLIVCAQSMDSLTPGRGMGHVLPESLKEAGAEAVFLNHAESQKTVSELYATIKRAKELGMITIVCADSTVEGNVMMEDLSKELDFSFRKNGSLVICLHEEDRPNLEALYERGVKNGVKELKILEHDEVLALEPNVTDDVVAALYAPTGGIVCPFELNIAMAENAATNGVEFRFNTEVRDIVKKDGGFELVTNNGAISTKCVVNGCNNYIASSGDTNCCVLHSNKCIECNI